MCCNFSILKKTENGLLIQMKCGNFQLSYKNLNFNLSQSELEGFLHYIKNIDCNYWEEEYRNSIYEKKIPIPTLQKNFIIMFDRSEIGELTVLLDFKIKNKTLKYNDINYPLNLN